MLQTNAFVLGSRERKLTLAGPFQPSQEALAAVESASRLRPITLTPLREQGFDRFAWINPLESPGGAPVLADGVELPPNNGAFLYLLQSGESVLYSVINRALYGDKLAERGTSATMHDALRRVSRTTDGLRRQQRHVAAEWRSRSRKSAVTPRESHAGAPAHRNSIRVRTSAAGPLQAGLESPGAAQAEDDVAWTGFVPQLVRDQIGRLPEALLNSHDADEGALPAPRELRVAAIFADASGFTALTERLSRLPDGAERMCEIMNAFLGRAVAPSEGTS